MLYVARFPLTVTVDPARVFRDGDSLLITPQLSLLGHGPTTSFTLPDGVVECADLDRVLADLAEITVVDDLLPASTIHPVVAFGALPFEPSAPGALNLHHATLAVGDDGGSWLSVVSGERRALPTTAEEADAWAQHLWPSHAGHNVSDPEGCVLTDESAEAFTVGVERALEEIEAGTLAKVVLARRITVTAPSAWDQAGVVSRFRAIEPSSTLFAMPVAGGAFIGASPELLVKRQGAQVISVPLAGTRARTSPSAEGDVEFLSAAKDGNEHQLVVDAIRAKLEGVCDLEPRSSSPEIVDLRSIRHLGTRIAGSLHHVDATTSALHLAALLHPTPAVGGVPSDLALARIGEWEPTTQRGPYAGPVGYVDGRGDGQWVVGIRAALIHDTVAEISAGAGIVSGSLPDHELDETSWKLQSIVDAVAPGVTISLVGREALHSG